MHKNHTLGLILTKKKNSSIFWGRNFRSFEWFFIVIKYLVAKDDVGRFTFTKTSYLLAQAYSETFPNLHKTAKNPFNLTFFFIIPNW